MGRVADAMVLGDCLEETARLLQPRPARRRGGLLQTSPGVMARRSRLAERTVLLHLEESASPGAALAEYTRRRRQHLGFYQFASRWLTPLFQSNLGVLGWARDAFMPLAARLPPVRRLMVRTMTGTVTGLLRAPLSLAAGERREAPRLPEGAG